MRYFFVNPNTPTDFLKRMSDFGVCIPLPLFASLPEPVSRHPDMLMAELDGTLFVHEGYAEGRALLENLGIPHLLSHTPVENKYPRDVALNCFTAGGILFCNPRTVSSDILAWAAAKKLSIASVKQGYTKCATAVAGGAVASADKTIIKAAEHAGIPALLLPPHHIDIEIYDTGFLGGASVLLDAHTLGFFGKIEVHPSYESLRAFFAERGVSLLSLSDAPLFDLGGAVVVKI